MVLPKYDEPYIIDAKTWSPPARARARGPRRGLGRRRHRQRALCARMALAPFDTTKWKSRQCDVTQPGVSGADSRLDHRYIDFFLAAADKREEALVGALQARQAQVAHLEKAARDRDRRFIELERRLSIAGSSNKAELPANKQVSKAWEVAVLSGMIGEGVDDGRFDRSGGTLTQSPSPQTGPRHQSRPSTTTIRRLTARMTTCALQEGKRMRAGRGRVRRRRWRRGCRPGGAESCRSSRKSWTNVCEKKKNSNSINK